MTQEDIVEPLRFGLTQNAIDSLEQAIELTAYPGEFQNESRKLKQAILFVGHGIELLLKERLRRIHPSLVYEKVEKFGNLDSRTVTVEQAILRLERIGGVLLSAQEASLIRSLRNTRNAIEHYEWETTIQEASSIIGRSLSFAIFFAQHHLSLEVIDYGHTKEGLVHDLMESNPEFASAYQSWPVESQSENLKSKSECGFCRGLGVSPDGGACGLCGHWHPFTGESPLFDDDDVPF